MQEKIKQWEEEIEKIAEKQKEMNQKSSERIRELRRKIQEAEQVLLQENNRLIAEAVREIYGNVSTESLEAFKLQIKKLKEEGNDPKQETAGGTDYAGNRL